MHCQSVKNPEFIYFKLTGTNFRHKDMKTQGKTGKNCWEEQTINVGRCVWGGDQKRPNRQVPPSTQWFRHRRLAWSAHSEGLGPASQHSGCVPDPGLQLLLLKVWEAETMAQVTGFPPLKWDPDCVHVPALHTAPQPPSPHSWGV